MSDPVTNADIDDVLSSIRKLISVGDKADTNISTQPEIVTSQAKDALNEADIDAESSTEKFVLTPSLMVVEDDPAKIEMEEGTDDGWGRLDGDRDHGFNFNVPDAQSSSEQSSLTDAITLMEAADADAGLNEPANAPTPENEEGPLELSNWVWEPSDSTDDVEKDDSQLHPKVAEASVTPDQSELVATIEELEAAVSGGAHDFEPDGTEVMGQTIAWPGTAERKLDEVEDAQTTTHSDFGSSEAEDSEVPIFTRHPETHDAATADADSGSHDEVGAALDEETLRALVSAAVREELTGPMGERITRNVRKLVRREIYRILSSNEFD